jgi:predicted GNAT family N-acyltransferase
VGVTTHGLEVRRAASAGEVTAALELRHAVFCDEQGVPLADELDGRDEEAIHLVASAEGGVMGTCRLLRGPGGTARLGRLAVAGHARRRGIGTALVRAAEDEARALGAHRVRLDAHVPAQALYAALGYQVLGQPFVDAGLPHVRMEKALA